METLLMELHLTCGSNSLQQSPILIQLIHTAKKNPFKDEWLPPIHQKTRNYQQQGCGWLVSLALDWFYGVLPFYTFIPFYGLCFPLQTIPPIYPYMITSLMWMLSPILVQTFSYCFSIVLLTFLFPWHHAPFVFCLFIFHTILHLLIDHSHPLSCLCFSFGLDYSEFWLIPIE